MTFSQILETPATLPGSIKEQLLALAPYMVDFTLKANGGFVINLKIPQEAFVTMALDHDALIENNMQVSVSIDTPEPISDGRLIRRQRYADVELMYR